MASTDNELYDSDIPWGLPPLPAPTALELEPSTPDELGWVYADLVASEVHFASVDADLEMYRALLSQALAQLTALSTVVQKQNSRIVDLQRQIRELLDLPPLEVR